MDADNCALACGLVSKAYVAQGAQALKQRTKLVKAMLSSRRLPAQGWDDDTIEVFIKVRCPAGCTHTAMLAAAGVPVACGVSCQAHACLVLSATRCAMRAAKGRMPGC